METNQSDLLTNYQELVKQINNRKNELKILEKERVAVKDELMKKYKEDLLNNSSMEKKLKYNLLLSKELCNVREFVLDKITLVRYAYEGMALDSDLYNKFGINIDDLGTTISRLKVYNISEDQLNNIYNLFDIFSEILVKYHCNNGNKKVI